ncbi:effector-associated constant component EACC1 [Catenuloplanes japonicus]|uniref:effector-associated constant component EACC1 n=1 Tax=Catenuloplanes japonicus TaxID=33876 RepID=UPI00052739EF|nr:hypothetical protein [Catenuloplanes japonicus]
MAETVLTMSVVSEDPAYLSEWLDLTRQLTEEGADCRLSTRNAVPEPGVKSTVDLAVVLEVVQQIGPPLILAVAEFLGRRRTASVLIRHGDVEVEIEQVSPAEAERIVRRILED